MAFEPLGNADLSLSILFGRSNIDRVSRHDSRPYPYHPLAHVGVIPADIKLEDLVIREYTRRKTSKYFLSFSLILFPSWKCLHNNPIILKSCKEKPGRIMVN